MTDNLSAGLEDYLEIICNLLETSQSVKAVEIAKKLNISRASVSEALARLSDKKLIIYEGHKGITITPEGLKKVHNHNKNENINKKEKHHKDRTPEILDIGLHTDDIATVSMLSGLKWIEPALPLMYSLSGYRAGIGYRN